MATKYEKARKGFDYACRQASKCRHDRYQMSCSSCPDEKTCEIQQRMARHKEVLDSERIIKVRIPII